MIGLFSRDGVTDVKEFLRMPVVRRPLDLGRFKAVSGVEKLVSRREIGIAVKCAYVTITRADVCKVGGIMRTYTLHLSRYSDALYALYALDVGNWGGARLPLGTWYLKLLTSYASYENIRRACACVFVYVRSFPSPPDLTKTYD